MYALLGLEVKYPRYSLKICQFSEIFEVAVNL